MILSRSRWTKLKTIRQLPEWVEVLVPESEADQYRAVCDNPIITCPDSIEGLGRLRNWCLDNFTEHTVIMIDDDINAFYRLTLEHAEKITGEEFVQVLINTCIMSRDAGATVFGFFQTDIRKFKGYDPFALNGWVGTIIGINGRKLRFRDDKFKVDIDMCLQGLLVDRIIWIDNRYFPTNQKDNNTGGNAKFRTEEAFNASVESMKRKWGSAITVRQGEFANQIKIALNVKRKQKLGG